MPWFIGNRLILLGSLLATATTAADAAQSPRERVSLNAGWRFSRFNSSPDSLTYDTLKPWILPTANNFVDNGTQYERPSGTAPGADVEFVQDGFDDSSWEALNLPHDWAIKGPFNAPGVSGDLGSLPINGVGWYRKNLTVASSDEGKSIFLDIDGAMSYSAVWLNGNLVGGWPYGYASFRLDLTPYVNVGEDNLLAIRLDNALDSSRWYPGAGIYRNIWLVTVDKTHVGQFGTYITTPTITASSATVNLVVEAENLGNASRQVDVTTDIYVLDAESGGAGADVVATFPSASASIEPGTKQSVNGSTTISNPLLWGPAPAQPQNLYVARTTISADGSTIDTYDTTFGVRTVVHDPDQGVLINGEPVRVQGTCNHHDHGALGAAFNTRAAQRQLQMLQEMGTNALRTSHNPPAPEIVEMADQMGFMVLDEIFDVWNEEKVDNDYHLLFPDWHEPDLRSFIRRDRNHPSVFAWSFGNEIPEQTTEEGAETAQMLKDIIREEDPTRLATIAMNSASASDAIGAVLDILGLNYQGEGNGNSLSSTYPDFHSAYPDQMLWGSETSSAVSTRGTYLFPVTSSNNAIVADGSGGDSVARQVSSYELYATSWGSSPDKVFAQQDRFYPWVAGEYVWTGWDYLGEPTPYSDTARSSYFGIIDLAGFPKDRFYLYQARWRPDHASAHILPHWSWPEREGLVTPVHVFSGADEAELFVNGVSAGRIERPASAWRFRWDNVTYAPGDLHVVTYRNGSVWAEDSRRTVGNATQLVLDADRSAIAADGYDLSFVSLAVADAAGDTVPRANNSITFAVESGPGEIVATDNGDPTDYTVFPSLTRSAFSGRALAIVRASAAGEIVVSASASGLEGARVTLTAA